MGRIGFVVEGLPVRSASGTNPSAQSSFPVLGPWTLFVASTADEAGRTDGWRSEKAGCRVGIVELHEDSEGYLVCPLRGEMMSSGASGALDAFGSATRATGR